VAPLATPPVDAPLEEVLLAEAKNLLDTCRLELLSKQNISSAAAAAAAAQAATSGGGGGVPAGMPSGAKTEVVFKKAAKLWAIHFITCELCQRTYSRNSNSTHYCEECRCNVCSACDCSVYHLSHQLELLEGLDGGSGGGGAVRSEEHTSELQSHHDIVCRLLLEKKKENSTSGDASQLRSHP